ncbi:Hypothetical_protein [Hexamita inflata]|uniref:Hypothetical_protein n=1 Tax=Hexamita inflata TaxID=28002 RepID=A0ABP1K4K5_9EUKA
MVNNQILRKYQIVNLVVNYMVMLDFRINALYKQSNQFQNTLRQLEITLLQPGYVSDSGLITVQTCCWDQVSISFTNLVLVRKWKASLGIQVLQFCRCRLYKKEFLRQWKDIMLQWLSGLDNNLKIVVNQNIPVYHLAQTDIESLTRFA